MAPDQPDSLSAVQVVPGSPEYESLLTWPFRDQPFYEGQVRRLLDADIRLRFQLRTCRIWIYRNGQGDTVGFGTLDVCDEYSQFASDNRHLYIPLLAVSPLFQKRGYGREIVEHLVHEAESIVRGPTDCSDLLFLDVYSLNKKAISLYEKFNFVVLNPENPLLDPQENNEPYLIMARRCR